MRILNILSGVAVLFTTLAFCPASTIISPRIVSPKLLLRGGWLPHSKCYRREPTPEGENEETCGCLAVNPPKKATEVNRRWAPSRMFAAYTVGFTIGFRGYNHHERFTSGSLAVHPPKR
jgi:hypothetical protein